MDMKIAILFFMCFLGSCNLTSYESALVEKAEPESISCQERLEGCSRFVKSVNSSDTIPRLLRNFHTIWGQPSGERDYTLLSPIERDSIFPDSCFIGQSFRQIFTNVLCDTQYLGTFRLISDFHEKRTRKLLFDESLVFVSSNFCNRMQNQFSSTSYD
jgi:hypothetical protein